MTTRELLISGTKEMGILLSERQVVSFLTFLDILQFWNKRINLTAKQEEREIIIRHFFDSLTSLSVVKGLEGPVLDVGCGAGFPSLPLLICEPKRSFTLLDSSKKKVFFLNEVKRKIELNYRVIWSRVEVLAHTEGERGSFPLVLSRALSPLNLLVELCVPLLQVGGVLVAFQAKEVEKEVEKAKNALVELQAQINTIIKVAVPFLPEERFLILIEKKGESSGDFPRRMDYMKKRPL